jgi:hypothetical protein
MLFMRRTAVLPAVLACLILLFNMGSYADFLRPFFNPKLSKAPRFSGSQLYNVTILSGLSEVSGYVGCFGDFNSDKLYVAPV